MSTDPPKTAATGLAREGFIPEVQALRALAVSLVLVFHLWPNLLPGGYSGVDVFFVISGFLITAHLHRQLRDDGRIHFASFYARRIRRLLPAAIGVLAVTLVATVLLVPRNLWLGFLQEIGASAVYVVNWLLAGNSVDYLASANAASPAQHYWTLSVEEQFYLVWPILLGLAWLVSRGRSRAVTLVIGLVLVASLAFSVYWTARNPEPAYFITTTRGWEFAAGGLLALAVGSEKWRRIIRSVPEVVLGVLGVGLIVFGGFWLSAASAFPGYLALIPVVGAVLVIASASGRSTIVRRVSALPPVQFVGSISYSLYLWHWPLIVLWPFAFGAAPGVVAKLVILAATVLLATASWLTLERPFSAGTSFLGRRTGRSFAFALVSALVVVGAVGGVYAYSVQRSADIASAIESASDGECFGAAAMDATRDCPTPFAVTPTVDAAFAATDLGVGVQVGACQVAAVPVPIPPCEFGDLVSPRGTMVLVGDSHAGQFIETLALVADDVDWKLQTYVQGSCPGLGVLTEGACRDWGRAVLDTIVADDTIDVVLVTNATAKYLTDPQTLDEAALAADLTRLVDAGKQVLIIRDPPGSYRGTPTEPAENVNECLGRTTVTDDPCTLPSDVMIVEDVLVRVAQNTPDVGFIDLTSYFCTPTLCHSVIGGLVVYADGGHMTVSYAESLAPFLRDALCSKIGCS